MARPPAWTLRSATAIAFASGRVVAVGVEDVVEDLAVVEEEELLDEEELLEVEELVVDMYADTVAVA